MRSLIADRVAKTGSCSILDVGGTEAYWRIDPSFADEFRGRVAITLANLEPAPTFDPMFRSMLADGCALPFATGEFDLVHSNSVIEHVGNDERRQAFASEVMRVGRSYYVQTPNLWFPYEPHYRLPLIQYTPASLRSWLLERSKCGFIPKQGSRQDAIKAVEGNRLLGKRQMMALFPDARLVREAFGPLTKSLIAIRG